MFYKTVLGVVVGMFATRGALAIMDEFAAKHQTSDASITIMLPPGFADPVIRGSQSEYRV